MKTGSSFPRISMTLLLLMLTAVFFAWAAFFEINQTVRAQGQVIPGSRTQIIQAADGGVLSRILVKEGQRVEAGEVLAVLEKDRSNAAYHESRSSVAALAAALVRAKAEAEGRLPDVVAELLGYLVVHVRFEQGLANIAHRVGDIGLGNAASSGQASIMAAQSAASLAK